PRCSTRYELRSVVLGEVAGDRPPAGIETVAEIVGNPDTDRVTWQVLAIRTALLHDGERRDRGGSPTDLAPALTKTDGTAWLEEQGPSQLWASHTALPPLGGQFPRLSTAPGSYAWRVDMYAP